MLCYVLPLDLLLSYGAVHRPSFIRRIAQGRLPGLTRIKTGPLFKSFAPGVTAPIDLRQSGFDAGQ